MYQQWSSTGGRSDAWCGKHFLHAKSLRRAAEIREQLQDIVGAQKLPMAACGADWDPLRKAICAGYYHQAAAARGIGEYANLRTAVAVQLHPTSALYGAGVLPDHVVYHELVLTSKEYMSVVTAVDPRWLAELGAVFYSVKEKGYSQREKRVHEKEWSRRMELEAEMEQDRRRERERADGEAAEEERRAAEGSRVNGSVRVGGGGVVRDAAVRKVVGSGAVRRPNVRRRGGIGF